MPTFNLSPSDSLEKHIANRIANMKKPGSAYFMEVNDSGTTKVYEVLLKYVDTDRKSVV